MCDDEHVVVSVRIKSRRFSSSEPFCLPLLLCEVGQIFLGLLQNSFFGGRLFLTNTGEGDLDSERQKKSNKKFESTIARRGKFRNIF